MISVTDGGHSYSFLFSFQVKMVKTKSGIWIRILNDGPLISFFNHFYAIKSHKLLLLKNLINE